MRSPSRRTLTRAGTGATVHLDALRAAGHSDGVGAPREVHALVINARTSANAYSTQTRGTHGKLHARAGRAKRGGVALGEAVSVCALWLGTAVGTYLVDNDTVLADASGSVAGEGNARHG